MSLAAAAHDRRAGDGFMPRQVILAAGWLPRPTVSVGVMGICFQVSTARIRRVTAGPVLTPRASLQVTSLLYMIPLGIGGATSTRVSNELGAGRPNAARLAAKAAVRKSKRGGGGWRAAARKRRAFPRSGRHDRGGGRHRDPAGKGQAAPHLYHGGAWRRLGEAHAHFDAGPLTRGTPLCLRRPPPRDAHTKR